MAWIYRIRNLRDGCVYIGQSLDIKERIRSHKLLLNKNSHSNVHLQRAYNKYGRESFEISTILICESDFLDFYETAIISLYKQVGKCYNLDGRRNKAVSEETRRKQSSWQIGRKLSEETCKKISAALKGKTRIIKEETRRKISKTLMGHKYNPTGEDDPKSKLLDADIQNIANDKRMNVVIAKEYGVDPSHISRIKRFRERGGRGRNP